MDNFDGRKNDRAGVAAKAGVTGETRTMVYRMVASRNTDGMTSRELEALPSLTHHGAVSAALTGLAKRGLLVRLQAQRDGYSIYVLPTKVNRRKFHSPANGINVDRDELTLLLRCARAVTSEQKEIIERLERRVGVTA
jgi:hypothetical protein